LDAATERGVEVVEGGLHSIVGVRKVEAVMSHEGLHPCDSVAILPRRAPSLPEVTCQKGRNGGALVDKSMRTSTSGIFAAGDCAELRLGSGSITLLLHSSAVVMGRTAGRNSAGGRIAEAGVAGSFGFKVFGVEICAAGITAKEGLAVGLDAIEVEDEGGGTSANARPLAASIVVDRESQRVYGMQLVGDGSLGLSSYISAVVGSHARLEEVADQEVAYNPLTDDKALPIRLTAGRIMKQLK
jgi:NADPH-dependent 2,4-dienoyl-CoA reductase/sulfur reductase-like enzyme